MHEVSVARQLMAAVVQHSARSRGDPPARLSRIVIRVGELAGVSPDALSFAFQCLAQDTPLAGVAVEWETVALAVACEACGARNPVRALVFRCPQCASPSTRVIAGRELELCRLEFAEEEIACELR